MDPTRRAIIAGTFGLLAVLAIAGACAPRPAATEPLSGRVTVGGSGAAYPAVKIVTSAFGASHPAVAFDYRPSSSGPAGVRSLTAGEITLATLGQLPSGDMSAIVLTPVASDAVVVAVHPSVALEGLSAEQLRGLYAGTITSWAELGVTGAPPLQVIDRPEDETAKIALRKILGGTLRPGPGVLTMPKEADMVRAVESTPGAIGFFSLSYLVERPGRARALRIDGVLPSVATVRSGAYPATRPILVAVRRSDAAASPVSQFLAFLASPAAEAALERVGYGPAR